MYDEILPIGELIFQKLKEKGRTLTWLAQKVGCDDSNLSKTLKNSRYIYSDLLYCFRRKRLCHPVPGRHLCPKLCYL